MSENMQLKRKIIIGTLTILLGSTVVCAYLILYNSGLVFKKTASSEIIDKLKKIQGKGGKFELTQNDIDELSKLLRPETKGDITLKGVNIEIVKDELVIKAPISYKKVNLLFSSKGKIDFTKDNFTYTAENFKIGKLTIPKKIVLSQISKSDNKNVYAEDNLIKINPSVVPFKINSLKVENNRISGTAAKQSSRIPFKNIDAKNVEETDKQLATAKQKKPLNTIDGAHGKPIEEKKKVINDNNNTVNEFKNKSSSSEKEKKGSGKQKEIKRDSLTKEKKVIPKIQSKDRVKNASFRNINRGNSEQLRKASGL
ncbi:hypothetical protein KPL35_06325 [Clostridium sp. CF011]|uniref:hypothetical protein n=1 Tax=Clostridium sp. CF011 TaxID=2843318 RepID=UPI001C0B53DE|nr:hypothetical protein [Clostridium sp. CF011]MBU3091690.1 hypothetical protein [Clostridium sp. CF011]WAG69401.1 hypothetical protein LL036_15590 [Clostridium sp. CF011]